MVLLSLPVGLTLLRRSIGDFTIIIVTAAAYKEPVISALFYLGVYNYLGA
jgi:hypothetical protein